MVSQTPAETEWLAKISWTKPKYFELNQESKAVLTENCDSQNFPATPFVCIFINHLRNKILKTWRDWRLKETGTSFEQKTHFSDNSGQNNWHK